MKVHYINILMFALPLNILVYNQRNHKSITYHTQNENPIKIHRSLCECELFAPQNYDNYPEMKAVIQGFDRQTSQRFREYDERMIKNRQKCKDQCDKDIQKIILKDKIENELKEKLATLETNINTKDLPICECEKSLTDKVEKGCLGCGVLGTGIAPNVGLFGEVVLGAWKAAALVTAKKLAEKAGIAKGLAEGTKAGIEAMMDVLNSDFGLSTLSGNPLEYFFSTTPYNNASRIAQAVYTKFEQSSCIPSGPVVVPSTDQTFCTKVIQKSLESGIYTPNSASMKTFIESNVQTMVLEAETVADAAAQTATNQATSLAIETNTATVNTTYASCQTAIIVSTVAILVIVFVMVIIYLILRYRRKKKMKRKLHYIKLLKE